MAAEAVEPSPSDVTKVRNAQIEQNVPDFGHSSMLPVVEYPEQLAKFQHLVCMSL